MFRCKSLCYQYAKSRSSLPSEIFKSHLLFGRPMHPEVDG
ncbi:hypothetical protein REIFOR_02234 [Reinekea forsetii]|uniref:Uncharacterized protein n=1 Tax=Reinekea forsetii TaxID=1336806 RepID=A0A2K8KRL3_9GAMM|nr:hypothetical protein REIFOR_02234 [Reinekea forsetii]